MQTHLYLHKENTDLPHDKYRGKYPLKHFDYGLSRDLVRKGDITCGLCGGEIRIVIGGFADATLLGWLFDRFRQEDGAIVTLDEHETTFAKLQFAGASVKSYRMNYDSRVKKGVVTIIVIEAKEIATDNDLFFTNK